MFVLRSKNQVVIRAKSLELVGGHSQHNVELKGDYARRAGAPDLTLDLKSFGCETIEGFFDLFQVEYESPKGEHSTTQEEEQVWQIVRDDLDGGRHYWSREGWTDEPLKALNFHPYDGRTGEYWAIKNVERLREQFPEESWENMTVAEKPPR